MASWADHHAADMGRVIDHADAEFRELATYQASAGGSPVSNVPVVLSEGNSNRVYLAGEKQTRTGMLTVRRENVSSLAKGDRFTVGADVWKCDEALTQDAESMTWSVVHDRLVRDVSQMQAGKSL